MEATTPELGPVGLWSPKSSTFSGSDSIVVEEITKLTAKYKQVRTKQISHPESSSKLCCYLETCRRALEQSLQLKSSYYLLLCMLLERPTGKGLYISTCACALGIPPPSSWLCSIAETDRHAKWSILVYRM